MINIGIIGIGNMGVTHLDVYAKRSDVRVVALADLLPERCSGQSRASGNIEGQAQGGFDYASAKHYADGMNLIADPNVHAVDICLPTTLHLRYALAALQAGKHVLVEKPLARTAAEAHELADAAEQSAGISMCAMCMRFWPAWDWLKNAILEKKYGNVLSAHFRRVASHPGGATYLSGRKSGGAVLDLHIHDTDFVQYCFGMPDSVSSSGYSSVTSELDHVTTQYQYKDVPLVMSEGGWAMAAGFGFRMQYTVNFERATAAFDMAASPQLSLWEPDKAVMPVELPTGMGYEHEIADFLECIRTNRQPTTVTMREAANSVSILEAEIRSVRSRSPEVIAMDEAQRRVQFPPSTRSRHQVLTQI